MAGDLVQIVTTVSDEATAAAIANTLVDGGLVACAHLERIRSIYRWEGELHDEEEVRVTLKTVAALAARVEQHLLEVHPYETPMILRHDVVHASSEYLAWVRNCTSGKDER